MASSLFCFRSAVKNVENNNIFVKKKYVRVRYAPLNVNVNDNACHINII